MELETLYQNAISSDKEPYYIERKDVFEESDVSELLEILDHAINKMKSSVQGYIEEVDKNKEGILLNGSSPYEAKIDNIRREASDVLHDIETLSYNLRSFAEAMSNFDEKQLTNLNIWYENYKGTLYSYVENTLNSRYLPYGISNLQSQNGILLRYNIIVGFHYGDTDATKWSQFPDYKTENVIYPFDGYPKPSIYIPYGSNSMYGVDYCVFDDYVWTDSYSSASISNYSDYYNEQQTKYDTGEAYKQLSYCFPDLVLDYATFTKTRASIKNNTYMQITSVGDKQIVPDVIFSNSRTGIERKFFVESGQDGYEQYLQTVTKANEKNIQAITNRAQVSQGTVVVLKNGITATFIGATDAAYWFSYEEGGETKYIKYGTQIKDFNVAKSNEKIPDMKTSSFISEDDFLDYMGIEEIKSININSIYGEAGKNTRVEFPRNYLKDNAVTTLSNLKDYQSQAFTFPPEIICVEPKTRYQIGNITITGGAYSQYLVYDHESKKYYFTDFGTFDNTYHIDKKSISISYDDLLKGLNN